MMSTMQIDHHSSFSFLLKGVIGGRTFFLIPLNPTVLVHANHRVRHFIRLDIRVCEWERIFDGFHVFRQLG